MNVSWRHMLAGAGIATFAATFALTAMSQQCITCAPPSPPPPPPPASNCCQAPRNLIVNVPGVNVATANVNVGATSTVVAAAGVSTTLSSGVVVSGGGSAGASAGGSFFGGGGGYYSNPGVEPSTINGLVVDDGFDARLVDEAIVGGQQYCIEKVVEEFQTKPVQALCVDDRNAMHLASRVDDELSVFGDYTGELYRCAADTRMQVTLGEMIDGKANFDAGETFSCGKGEALHHARGGVLQCRPQAPERSGNERSLLGKYGPGVKLVSMSVKKTICEPATPQTVTKVNREVKVAGDLVLDGGVGQGY